MPVSLRACSLILAVSTVTGGAFAEGAEGTTKPGAAAKPSAEVRRDPKGIKGISPFWEALKKGDDAYVARDFDGAIAAYTEALNREPKHPLGHYRIGEVHLAKGDHDKAEAAWQAALRFVSGDPRLRAKILFVLADLRERRGALAEAKTAWSSYAKQIKAKPKAAGYPKTPPERTKRIVTWVDMKQKYAAVKQRIAERLAEVEKKQREDAK
jgi:tetratricopeptide (TPR) repeat protein